MSDFVEREDVEMTNYTRSSELSDHEEHSDDIEELDGGIKGKLQQFRAYTFKS